MLLLVYVVLTILTLFLYHLSRTKLNYWKGKNIYYLIPIPIIGNYGKFILQQRTLGETIQNICRKIPEEPMIGAYYGTQPVLIVQDPELLKLVLTKDYYFFSRREISDFSHKELFTQSLFFTYGDKWKVLRQNLTPIFSSSKMKNMFHHIQKCTKIFETTMDRQMEQSHEINVVIHMARFTMDCIGSCVFGINTKAMEEADGNPFRLIGDKLFESSVVRGAKITMRSIWPALFYGLGFKTFPTEADQFFRKLLTEVFEERFKSPPRHDFIDLLLELMQERRVKGDTIENLNNLKQEKANLEVNYDMLISQSIAFFAAGFDTSANTMAFTLFELAKNASCQDRVIVEVDKYLESRDGCVQYDCVTELPYLDQCISEALRLYPVLGHLTREVHAHYTFPNGVTVERNMPVHIPVLHLHKDPRHFPEPELFRPERFSPENKAKIKQYTYFPFGEGPRICIGMRFAKMQVLSGLVTLLKKFQVALADGMPEDLELDPRGLVTQTKEPIRLKLVERIRSV